MLKLKVSDHQELFTAGEEVPGRITSIIPEYVDAIDSADGDLFSMLLQHYYDYYLIYNDRERWKSRILAAFGEKRTWLLEMLKTTAYTYNPINNYDMTETATIAKKSDIIDTTDSSSHSDSGAYEFPMDTQISKQVNHTDGSATANVARVSTDEVNETHSLTRSGNIGVMTTQDMIRQQREIQVVLIGYLYEIFDDYLFLDVDRMEE